MFSVNACHVLSCLRVPVGALAARSVEGYKNRKTKVYFSEQGASQTFFFLAKGDFERRENVYVSPDCECATVLHNGGHCLFGGESVGILFQ